MTFAAKPYLQEVSIRPYAEIDLDRYPYSIPFVREIGYLTLNFLSARMVLASRVSLKPLRSPLATGQHPD